jgi:TetR/AcrR family transcriptional repressor of bet genes
MPKHVNHDERRRLIAQALWRVVVEGGVDAVSFRTVAAEAGVSVALVQHYFGNRRDLLVWSVDHQSDTLGVAIAARTERLGADRTPRRTLDVILQSFLPLDDERRRSMVVYHAFAAAAVTDRSLLTDRIQERGLGFIAVVADLLAGARLPPGTDPAVEARGLVTMILGLSLAMLMEQVTGGEAVAVVDHHLDRLF